MAAKTTTTARKTTRSAAATTPKPLDAAKHLEALVDNVLAQGNALDVAKLSTEAIAELRKAVSFLSAARQNAVAQAKAEGTSYSELARATGMTPARMAAIGNGRGGYVRVNDRKSREIEVDGTDTPAEEPAAEKPAKAPRTRKATATKVEAPEVDLDAYVATMSMGAIRSVAKIAGQTAPTGGKRAELVAWALANPALKARLVAGATASM